MSTNSFPGTILVVDDMQANIDLLKRLLEPEGYLVLTAHDGASAIAATERYQPDLVLLDIMIPPPSGFDVCQTIKQNVSTRHIVVILITGLQHPENRLRGRSVGADDFITKPFDLEDVRTRVRKFFDYGRLTATMIRRQHGPGAVSV